MNDIIRVGYKRKNWQYMVVTNEEVIGKIIMLLQDAKVKQISIKKEN